VGTPGAPEELDEFAKPETSVCGFIKWIHCWTERDKYQPGSGL